MSSLSDEQIAEIRNEFNLRGKIAAVKLYKTWADCTLLEAKVAVEALESDEPIPIPQRPDPAAADQSLSEVDQAIANGNKIEAIKRHRELTGLSPLESAQFVESRMNRPKSRTLYETSPTADPQDLHSPVIHPERSGCFSVLLLFVVLATGSTLALCPPRHKSPVPNHRMRELTNGLIAFVPGVQSPDTFPTRKRRSLR